MSQDDLVQFEDYMAAIGRRRKLIGVVVVGFVVIGATLSLLSTKEFTSESRVSVTPVFAPGTADSDEVNIDTERGIAKSSAVATIAQRRLDSDTSPSDLLDQLTVDPVGESTILAIRYRSGNPESAQQGADAFARAYLEFRGAEADRATSQAREDIVEERAANSRETAALRADLADMGSGSPPFVETSARIRSLDSARGRLDSQLQNLVSDLAEPGTIIDEAETPSSPSSPGLMLYVAGAALIGLVLALTTAFMLERRNLRDRNTPRAADPEPRPALGAGDLTFAPALDVSLTPSVPVAPLAPDRRAVAALPAPKPEPTTTPAAAATADRRRHRDASQALAGLQVELLGNVPRLSNDAGEPAFDAVALGGPAGEALRRLHTTLHPRLDQHGARVVFVTSALERGVTVGLAGGLAATAALAGQDALLIAGDLHQPRLHDRLELGNDQGLAEVLNGTRPMSQVLQGWSGIEALCVVTAGRPGPDPSALVSAERLRAQLATIRNEFQLIVIEGPPLGETVDATIMASVSDAVILAVDPRRSAEHELGAAVQRLREAKAPLLGAVVVEARGPRDALAPVGATAGSPVRG